MVQREAERQAARPNHQSRKRQLWEMERQVKRDLKATGRLPYAIHAPSKTPYHRGQSDAA